MYNYKKQHKLDDRRGGKMDSFDRPERTEPPRRLFAALERASASFARLDQALTMHPLRNAFIYRFRLDAVRRQAGADGQLIEPWHLAALLEGVRLRMDPYLSIAERGAIFEAARHALTLHQWIAQPDFDQEGEVQTALQAIERVAMRSSPLLGAAEAAYEWLANGGRRAPLRGALIRYWRARGVLRQPVPLTGPQALMGDIPFDRSSWQPLLLQALAEEAEAGLDLLRDLDRAWRTARTALGKRRRNSRAVQAIDLLAAAPIISAHTLATRLDMAVSNALALLDEFQSAGLVVELTYRSKRRLFGLAGMARMRDFVAPPRRPEPGRGRGRPRLIAEPPDPVPSMGPPDIAHPAALPRLEFDYSDLDAAMAAADQAIRDTRLSLDRI
ncbi:hypothetical protein APM_0206 [Acidiphilium sp. PM]|nr:hypothetical protein APM_0206 [Acidiphilium sp. PM]